MRYRAVPSHERISERERIAEATVDCEAQANTLSGAMRMAGVSMKESGAALGRVGRSGIDPAKFCGPQVIHK